ncbi:MAG: two-component system response regulator [Firmicutes bacterium HGW-Firmicutes-1]|nr:MAG: two-component system response regulator [Firmicutes bacterium HGW-Firmicutes-1]
MYKNEDFLRERLTIIICEDTQENVDILVEALNDQYDIMIANNGRAAIDIIEKHMPDLVLLDIIMPEMDGYKVCSYLKENEKLKDIPIIFISGMTSKYDKKKGFSLGAVDYITKPFDVEEVQARVHTQISIVKKRNIVKYENKFLQLEVYERDAQLEEAYQKLEFAYLETMDRLSRAAEYKDDNTGLHVKRVGKISSSIARYLDMDPQVVYAIEHAAPLHDIGKIGVPESILLKKGKLDDEEWEIMKTHTTIGRNILKNSSSSIVNMAELIAYTHHEKWNGRGYPLGLVGEQIPKVSRIVAVSDVFDALTSERPYKKAFSCDTAIDIILEESGEHFDPSVVDAFMKALDEIKALLTILGK